MSTVIASSSLYPFCLYRMFGDDRGFSLILDIYSGTRPDKSVIEAADVYEAGNTGWMDSAKWDTFVQTTQGDTIIRRFVLPDFSKDIVPMSEKTFRFGFGLRLTNDFKLDANTNNIYNTGVAGWFAIRSVEPGLATTHYMFTGDITDLEGAGDLKLLSTNIQAESFVRPSNVTIDLGSLTV